MRYATQDNIRRHPALAKEKAEKVASAVARIHRVDATIKRCTGNKQGQEEVCSCEHAADAFLKSTFFPKMEVQERGLPPETTDKIQAGFYDSLAELARHYRFKPDDTKMFIYPYNMVLSLWEIKDHLKRHIKDWHSVRLIQDDKGKIIFTSRERYDTGTSLYYIPVMPLYKMLRSTETKNAAKLLLSVFSYLYHVAGIPYYRQEGAYMYWEYEMICDWIEHDDDSEFDNHKSALEAARWCGEKMEQKIGNPKNMKVFAKRMEAFRPENDFERECLKVAKGILSLYTDYPATSVFQHAKHVPGDEGQEDDEVITMEKYISFISDNKGWLYETIAEWVNNEFIEYSEIEEPTIMKIFDGSTNNNLNLDFESRLFPLIGDLCYLLDND